MNDENRFETVIDLLQKDMKIIQRADHFSFSIDSLLVAEFATITRTTKKIVDLGTGNGVIPLFLSKRTDSKIYGIEIQKISSELAKRNVELNKLGDQIEIINDDMKNWETHFKRGSMDLVVTNPPFFKFHGEEKQLNDLDQLSLARHEITINLDSLLATSASLLKDKGYFVMVHRVDRLIDIIETMKKYRIEPKRIQFCYTKIEKEGKILLVEGVKNGNSGLRVLPPLIAHDENGDYSETVLKMFK
ncbi:MULTISPECIES: tRNA1(Val) (adenine(37)-N6)-methyltransferase [unclassified Fusobacterium]|uniref:tRNA1(Val) (adenine(37)-N6)-methyltransferase n=1 Tax=unclassified Fusobacterium TaxID=2648384 RepID=UPI002622D5D6|nr:tRNA1(Val) (adenine(37)-N6)-methyltransferase [Fusobacterium sp.]